MTKDKAANIKTERAAGMGTVTKDIGATRGMSRVQTHRITDSINITDNKNISQYRGRKLAHKEGRPRRNGSVDNAALVRRSTPSR